jgi:U3 small nucleolar RNA-associated protein 21
MGVVRAKKASITSSTGNSLIKEQKRLQNSRLLQCFRAIGLIIDDLPFVWYGMGKESFITASLGKSFVVYKCDKLTPVLVSPQLPKKILALEVYAKKQLTFTANGRNILVWKRVEQVNQFTGHHKGNIKQLLSVGNILFSLDEARHLCVWDMNTMEFLSELNFPAGFTPSFMMHPSTYLNKILIGSEEGTLELWNIRSMKCIYSFKGWGSAVTSIHQSPAVDVVGIGLADGKVYMHNLQYDKSLMDFHQEGSKVTAISFRTDSAAPEPFAVTGSTSGDIAVWNLKSKRLENMIVGAHEGMVVSLFFLPNEPILVSSGVDNSLKMWIFDNLNGTARLLKSREGHKAPPTRIRYYGNNTLASMTDGSDGTCCQILSAGQDRAFRVFHTAREQQSTEMSQGPVLKKAKKMNIRVEDLKLPPITQFAAMETRERDWSNVVTCHENEMAAYVWRFERRAIGKKILRQFDPSDKVAPGTEEDIRRKNSQATSVGISTCGSFAVVGSIGGAIFKYNMQSGEARGSYPTAATPKAPLIRSLTLPGSQPTIVQDTSGPDSHQGPVSGVVVDALNRQVISGGIDGILKFWDFTKHQLLAQVDVGSPICQLEIHRDSNLICVSSDDQILRIYDITTRKLVRRFQGHTNRITDVVFSNDARWLFSSSADASLRIWDLPTGKCIDWLKFHKPVTGLAISPTGEFLATTHVGNVGIFLWSNRHFFTDVFLDPEPKEPILMDIHL